MVRHNRLQLVDLVLLTLVQNRVICEVGQAQGMKTE